MPASSALCCRHRSRNAIPCWTTRLVTERSRGVVLPTVISTVHTNPAAVGPPAPVHCGELVSKPADLHREALLAEPGDVEPLVHRETTLRAEGLDVVPSTAGAEAPVAGDDDVVGGMREPLGQGHMAMPGERRVDGLQGPQARRGVTPGRVAR
jgi:hypothetical protein